MKKVRWAVAAAAMMLGGAWASAGQADQTPGARTTIAALDLPGVVAALNEDRAALTYYLAELHRRYPDKVEAPDMAGLPALGAASVAALRAMSDDQVASEIERVSAEVDRLVARGEALSTPAAAPPPAPVSRPAVAAASEAGSDNPYCYKMYGKAYSLCVSDDRGCKMIAANDWGICKKTGRWP